LQVRQHITLCWTQWNNNEVDNTHYLALFREIWFRWTTKTAIKVCNTSSSVYCRLSTVRTASTTPHIVREYTRIVKYELDAGEVGSCLLQSRTIASCRWMVRSRPPSPPQLTCSFPTSACQDISFVTVELRVAMKRQ
jgi:hypothetical protein